MNNKQTSQNGYSRSSTSGTGAPNNQSGFQGAFMTNNNAAFDGTFDHARDYSLNPYGLSTPRGYETREYTDMKKPDEKSTQGMTTNPRPGPQRLNANAPEFRPGQGTFFKAEASAPVFGAYLSGATGPNRNSGSFTHSQSRGYGAFSASTSSLTLGQHFKSPGWNDVMSTKAHTGQEVEYGRGQFGAFEAPNPSEFPDADQKYPVENYHGPVTSEKIEEHFSALPFAPSRYVVESQRAALAKLLGGGETNMNFPTSQDTPLPFSDIDYMPLQEDGGPFNDHSDNEEDSNHNDAYAHSETHETKNELKKKEEEMNGGGNYKGDVDLENEWTPDTLNCKVFVTGIPPYASRKEIFDSIHEGKIYSFSYNPADGEKFKTAAASISFATRAGADRFYHKAGTQGVYILGNRLRVKRDRTKMPPLDDWDNIQSRVVRVYGPPGTLNAQRLVHVLHKFIKFELVHVTQNTIDRGQRDIVTIHFESIVGQSRSGVKCLLQLAKDEGIPGAVHCRYQPDPCDPSPRYRDRDNLDHPEWEL